MTLKEINLYAVRRLLGYLGAGFIALLLLVFIPYGTWVLLSPDWTVTRIFVICICIAEGATIIILSVIALVFSMED